MSPKTNSQEMNGEEMNGEEMNGEEMNGEEMNGEETNNESEPKSPVTGLYINSRSKSEYYVIDVIDFIGSSPGAFALLAVNLRSKNLIILTAEALDRYFTRVTDTKSAKKINKKYGQLMNVSVPIELFCGLIKELKEKSKELDEILDFAMHDAR